MTTRIVDTYNHNVRQTLSFLKSTVQYDDLIAKSIRLSDDRGYLVPVCRLHEQDDNLIQLLALWRKENQFAYANRFEVTDEGTRKWLDNQLLAIEDRLLFLVLDSLGRPVGHLGFNNAINDQCAIEVDNVLRGDKNAERGMMTYALIRLISWAEEHLLPKVIYLRVLKDNLHAIKYYENNSFIIVGEEPLYATTNGDYTCYGEDKEKQQAGVTPDNAYLRMEWAPPSWNDDFIPEKTILTAGPSIGSQETSYAFDATRFGWNNLWSKYLDKLEDRFREYIGADYVIPTSSCTGALHLALLGLGIGPGDEVIVPELTWVASANAVLYVGATPVFADVEPDTWCLDVDSAQSLVSPKTKAIIPVHLYGHPCNMKKVMEFATSHNLHVVEDAAPAIGAEFEGDRVGCMGTAGAFSFQGAKLVVSGEGGVFLTNDKHLYDRVLCYANQGRVPGTFWINQNGVKYKMSNVQAAIALGQMERIDHLIEMKRRVYKTYQDRLKDIPFVTIHQEATWARSICWMTSILLDVEAPISRDELMAALKQDYHIDTRPVFPTISQYPIWNRNQDPQPIAGKISQNAVNLPSGVCLREQEIDYVCRSLAKLLK